MNDDSRLARLQAWLAERSWELPTEAVTGLLAYLDAMLEQNRSINLTSIRDPEQALVLHALDSLAPVALALAPRRALDLGTGNGFPGLAMRAIHPDLELSLMDRTAKKLRAIEVALQAAGLPAVDCIPLDALQAASRKELKHHFDLITVRAVGAPEEIGPIAGRMLAKDGDLLLWLSADTAAPGRLGSQLQLREELSYSLPEPAARKRRLACYGRRA
ncbi:MAG: 16S rRNA (guanine(527)-N(7))-methyltransferase RsmG [Planctomycetota bacterium]|jgi:16S rRNA (guanine527-N7)-methyltransferase